MLDAESIHSTESTAVGKMRSSSPESPRPDFPLAFGYTKPSPLAKKPAAVRPLPARPLASAIEDSSDDDSDVSSSDDGDPVIPPWDMDRFAMTASPTSSSSSNKKKTTTPKTVKKKPTPAKKKKKKKKPLAPAAPPSKASIARSARSLSARARSAAQSVADMKDRLFFDDDEASARQAEFDNVCELLENAADDIDDDTTLGEQKLTEVRAALEHLDELWALTDDLHDRVAERCRTVSSTIGNPQDGFASRCRVRRVGPDGDAALRGQNECVAGGCILKGETAPYPGVVVSSLPEQKALLEPLRPIDRVKWSCFSYSFSSHLPDEVVDDGSGRDQTRRTDDIASAPAVLAAPPKPKKNYRVPDETFCPELWPVLDGAVMTYVNDACGPENRTTQRLAERQNVEYVETFDGEDPQSWRVDVRATRVIPYDEVLLSDYGSEYWANWKEHIHTRAMKRLDQRLNDLFAPSLVRDGRRRVRVESRVHQWLRLAEALDRSQRGLPPIVEEDLDFDDDLDDDSSLFDDDDDDDDDVEEVRQVSGGIYHNQPPRKKMMGDDLRPPPIVVSSSSSTASTAQAVSSSKVMSPVVKKKKKKKLVASPASAKRSQPPLSSSDKKKKKKVTPPRPTPQKKRVSSSMSLDVSRRQPEDDESPAPKKPKPSSGSSPRNGRPKTAAPHWRHVLGERVAYFTRSKGCRSQPAVAARLAVDATSRDPMLEHLYETAFRAKGKPRFEAWWDDGQVYPLETLRPVPSSYAQLDGTFDVDFVDGEHATVKRVTPVLAPAVWAHLDRLPLGTWCRPRGSLAKSQWGVVVDYLHTGESTVYDVKLDGAKKSDRFKESDLEPIFVVRSDDDDDDGPWQEAAPLSQLILLDQ